MFVFIYLIKPIAYNLIWSGSLTRRRRTRNRSSASPSAYATLLSSSSSTVGRCRGRRRVCCCWKLYSVIFQIYLLRLLIARERRGNFLSASWHMQKLDPPMPFPAEQQRHLLHLVQGQEDDLCHILGLAREWINGSVMKTSWVNGVSTGWPICFGKDLC